MIICKPVGIQESCHLVPILVQPWRSTRVSARDSERRTAFPEVLEELSVLRGCEEAAGLA